MGENILVMERPSQGSGVKICPIRHTSVVVQSSKARRVEITNHSELGTFAWNIMEWILVHELDKKIAGVETEEKYRR